MRAGSRTPPLDRASLPLPPPPSSSSPPRPSSRPRDAAGRPLPHFPPGRSRAPRTPLCLLVALLVLLLCAALPAAADVPAGRASPHRRVLVLLDALDTKDKYSNFWSSLEARGHSLDFKQAGNDEIAIEEFGVPSYESLILFAPKSKSWGPNLEPRTVVDFVKKGGNIIVSLDTGFHESWRAMAYEFGVEFDDRDTLMIDHFTYDTAYGKGNASSHTRLAVTNVNSDAGPVLDPGGQRKRVELAAPVLYEGVGHRISSDNNPLVLNVLRGHRFSYSYQTDRTLDADPLVGGAGTALVSAVQAKNNARAMFTGSLKLFSDEFWLAPVQPKGGSRHAKSGNEYLLKEVTKWVFREKGILRVVSAKHNKAGMLEQPSHYRIKDNMTYTLQLEQFHDGKWLPFVPDDAQLEVRMLDPYIRRTLQRETSSSALTTTVTLPDVYGVFTLRVNFKRPGLSNIVHSMTVPIHPFRHNEYPRFLSQAYPYYASAFSMVFGFLAVSMVWLFHMDRGPAAKAKKKS